MVDDFDGCVEDPSLEDHDLLDFDQEEQSSLEDHHDLPDFVECQQSLLDLGEDQLLLLLVEPGELAILPLLDPNW